LLGHVVIEMMVGLPLHLKRLYHHEPVQQLFFF
jgi:hypothetical protein